MCGICIYVAYFSLVQRTMILSYYSQVSVFFVSYIRCNIDLCIVRMGQHSRSVNKSSQKGETSNLNHRASLLMNLIPDIMESIWMITMTFSAIKNLPIQKTISTNGYELTTYSTLIRIKGQKTIPLKEAFYKKKKCKNVSWIRFPDPHLQSLLLCKISFWSTDFSLPISEASSRKQG